MDEIETARKYLELGITPVMTAHSESVEEESEHRSLNTREDFQEMTGTSSGRRLKCTYKSPKGKPPVQTRIGGA